MDDDNSIVIVDDDGEMILEITNDTNPERTSKAREGLRNLKFKMDMPPLLIPKAHRVPMAIIRIRLSKPTVPDMRSGGGYLPASAALRGMSRPSGCFHARLPIPLERPGRDRGRGAIRPLLPALPPRA